jgi:D-3-phosphoglycerate dehydrogenase
MPSSTKYFIDFDSTFTKVEALDVLAEIVLANHPNKKTICGQIEHITKEAMQGSLSFDIALKKRLDLLPINAHDIQSLIHILETKISDSFVQYKQLLRQHAAQVYIISGGFIDFIAPIVLPFGIKPEHIFANQFIYDSHQQVIGYNTTNFLSQPKGKVLKMQSLNFKAEQCIIIGDGFTDYEIRQAGLAKSFYLYCENITRENLIPKADRIVKSIDDIFNP